MATAVKRKSASLNGRILHVKAARGKKRELVRYLTLGEIKCCNFKNLNFGKKSQKS